MYPDVNNPQLSNARKKKNPDKERNPRGNLYYFLTGEGKRRRRGGLCGKLHREV
jgi:hypothetical protein